MTESIRIAIVALVPLAAGACADDRDPAPAGATERAAAFAIVGQMTSLYELTRDPSDGSRLIAAVRFDAAAQLIAPTRPPVVWSRPPALAAMPACVTRTSTTATFSGCELDGHWLDGTLSRAGPAVNAEIIDVFILDAGSQGATSIDGTLTLTGTGIDGAVNIDADWTQTERDISLHAAVAFDGVSLDDTGCPIAGAMAVSGTLSAPPRVTELAVQFGPECGDMHVLR